MYFSSKENAFSASSCSRKQVRFNSSGVSSPSDAQSPRPLSELQNLRKLDVFSQNGDKTVTKHLMKDNNTYLPPKLFDFNVKCDVFIPKPSSDLELSVYESSTVEDGRTKCVKDVCFDKRLLENDAPYTFSPAKMPLTNPLKARSGFMGLPTDLATSAANSKKEFHNEQTNDDSTLDFFTKPNTIGNIYGEKPALDKSVAACKNNQLIKKEKVGATNVGRHATRKEQIQNYECRTQNRMRNSNYECSDADDRQCNSRSDCFSSPRCCSKKICREREAKCCKDTHCRKYQRNDCNCCEYAIDNRQQLDPVEEKRKTIEKKYRGDDMTNISVVKRKDDEPTVSDLYQIIQMQNKQLLMLQERFDKFLMTNETNTRNRQSIRNDANLQPNLDNQYAANDVNCVEHISIGVMTSFEMIMSSNYVTKQNLNADVRNEKNFIDEGVQTSVRNNNANKETRKVLTDDRQQVVNERLTNDCERNFLDGISRVNNVPSPKRFENNVLDKIVEENHETVARNVISPTVRHDGDREMDDVNGAPRRQNEGWTFYNNVVDRVNNLLNSPPNNLNKEKQPSPKAATPSPPPHPRQQAVTAYNVEPQPATALDRSPVGPTPKLMTQIPSQAVTIGINQPLSELSLHMRQLATKYNIPPPTKVCQPSGHPTAYKRVTNTEHQKGGLYNSNDNHRQHFAVDRIDYNLTNGNPITNNNYPNVFMDNVRPQNLFVDGGQPLDYGRQYQDGRRYETVRAFDDRRMQNLVVDPDNGYRGVATDVSFATLQYMKRYQLLTVTNEHPSPAVGVATPPSIPLPPAYKNPSRILDITTLKQQPKLL